MIVTNKIAELARIVRQQVKPGIEKGEVYVLAQNVVDEGGHPQEFVDRITYRVWRSLNGVS